MTSEEKQSIYSLLKTVSSWTAGFIPAEYRTEPPVFTDDITVPAGVQTKAAEKPQQSSSLEQKPKTEETGRLTLDSLYKRFRSAQTAYWHQKEFTLFRVKDVKNLMFLLSVKAQVKKKTKQAARL